jgi:uncharacterized protein (TIGR03437 family)
MNSSSKVKIFLLLGGFCPGVFAQGPYIISTVAGGAPPPTPVTAVNAPIGDVEGLAVDGSGNVFFTGARCLFKVDSSGILTRLAGNSRPGYAGDGGPATAAQMTADGGIAVDPAGNILVADTTGGSGRIRRVSASGVITTVAGGGATSPGDGGPAIAAYMYDVTDVAVDAGGNIYIAEATENRVRKVTADGVITTVAGTGVAGFAGDGGPAVNALLNVPMGVAVDANGDVFIADTYNLRVRKVSPAGVITTVAGNGAPDLGNAIPPGALATNIPISSAYVSSDPAGNLLLCSASGVLRISPGGVITQLAGAAKVPVANRDQATSAAISPCRAVADPSGNILVSSNLVQKISPAGTVSPFAGNGEFTSGDGGPATAAQFYEPGAVAIDGSGNLFVVDNFTSVVRRIAANGIVTTLTGGLPAPQGEPATDIFMNVDSIAADASGNLFVTSGIAPAGLYKVSASGAVTTVTTFTISNNGQLSYLFGGMTVDGSGNVYLSTPVDVLKVTPAGIVTTVAGNGTAGFTGDGGPATSAQLNNATDVAVDAAGNIFIADASNYRIRKVDTNGVITTVAGTGGGGQASFTLGVPALSAALAPVSVSVDNSGNLFIADSVSGILAMTTYGSIYYVTGSVGPYTGDGGPASTAHMFYPCCVRLDGTGSVYVSDSRDNAVRLLRPADTSTIIGSVVDAASGLPGAVSPGKIVALYGAGLGPASLLANQPANNVFSTQLVGTTVSFNGIPAPILYTSATQVAAIVPYEISGALTAQITVSYQGQVSDPVVVPVAASAPSFFSLYGTGAGQIAAVNLDGSLNEATQPAGIGGFVSLFATGEGQTLPGGVDGKVALTQPYPQPVLPVTVTVGGLPAQVLYAGAAPTGVAGLMQINIQIPQSVAPGGYVPVVLQVGNNSTVSGAAWIAVSPN